MKIAYVYDAVYPWVKGGVEKRIYEIGRRLVKRGHEVHWYGLKWWNGSRDLCLEGINLHGIGVWNALYVNGRRSIKEGLYSGMKTLMGLKGDFDVIDCQEFPYFPCFSSKVFSLFSGSKLVITWHEVWGDYWFKYLGRRGVFGYLIEKLVARLTKMNVAVSESTKKDLERMGVKNVKLIPNGIDLKEIKLVEATEESDIIFAGRLVKDKNVDAIIRAVGLVREYNPDVKCIVIGDGPERGKLEKLVYELNVDENVIFTGFLEKHEDVISYMKASKVFVLPSVREGFGIAALEANACGLPVVTIRHERNAVCSLVRNGESGFICEPSIKSLAEKLLTGLEYWKIMRNKCVENAEKYDWNNIVDMLEKFYESG